MAPGNTQALQALARARVPHEVHTYELVDSEATYGESVAATLGVPPARLFKTLVAEVDGRPAVAIVPTDRQLSLKKLAGAAGGKRARLADAADAERWTGYVTGGISPFGQKRSLPGFVDTRLFDHGTIFVSAGQRGLQVELAPKDLVSLLDAKVVTGLAEG